MPSIDDIVTRLLAQSHPLLMVDTCSVLDVVRGIARDGADLRNQIAAFEILSAATSTPPLCGILTASVIRGEFAEHLPSAVEEFERFFRKQQEWTLRLNKIAITGGFPESLTPFDVGMIDFLKDKAVGLINASFEIETEDFLRLRAGQRTVDARAPSRKGKDSYKDCLIFEEYIEFARRAQTAGFGENIVFITSNTQDFCDQKPSTQFREEIRADAAAANIELCQHWQQAQHLLLR